MKEDLIFSFNDSFVVDCPAFAAYKVETLPDGTYAVTFTYQTSAVDVFLIGEFNN